MDFIYRNLSLLLILPALYVGMIAFLYFNQRSFTYVPDTAHPHLPNAIEVSVKTQDGLALNGAYFPPKDGKSVLLMFHGNAGHIGHRYYKLPPLLENGYGVLLAEYRGYGGNQGTPTEAGLHMDAAGYYDWLIQRGVTADRIVVHGESLGTGVAVRLAAERQVDGIILETPYSSLLDIGKRHYPFILGLKYLMHDQFRSIDVIGDLRIPKLFIIAGRDKVLGAETGLALYNAAPEPKTLALLETAGHNDHYAHGAGNKVLEFLKALENQNP